MDNQQTIATRIRKAREFADLTQENMAKALGITQQQYSLLEKGEAKITKERIAKIAEVLGTTPEKIAEFDESKFFGNMEGNTFNDSSVTNLGDINHIYENHNKEIKEIYEARITSLETEITRLHELLKQALTK